MHRRERAIQRQREREGVGEKDFQDVWCDITSISKIMLWPKKLYSDYGTEYSVSAGLSLSDQCCYCLKCSCDNNTVLLFFNHDFILGRLQRMWWGGVQAFWLCFCNLSVCMWVWMLLIIMLTELGQGVNLRRGSRGAWLWWRKHSSPGLVGIRKDETGHVSRNFWCAYLPAAHLRHTDAGALLHPGWFHSYCRQLVLIHHPSHPNDYKASSRCSAECESCSLSPRHPVNLFTLTLASPGLFPFNCSPGV